VIVSGLRPSENSCLATPSFNFQSSEASMNQFRQMAAGMDQHMRQLSAQGVHDSQVILDRMMGYVPELHAIWTGTSDDQLVALFHEFSEFYRYARLMEEASEAERNKPSRPDDGRAPFSEQDKPRAARLLTTAATLERGYQRFRKSGSQLPIKERDELYRQWLSEVDSFQSSFRAQGAEPKALEYVKEGFSRLAERIKKLAG
jgi:hypothetical protein